MRGARGDVADLVRLAVRHGWSVAALKNGHLAFRDTGGRWVANVSPKPGSAKAVVTLRSALRRAGLPVPK